MALKKAALVEEVKNKIYMLKDGLRPLTYTLSNRHKADLPLQYFDKKTNTLKPLRYATNQESIFISEQTGEVTLGNIVFEAGVLVVSHENPTLQKFLDLHPRNGFLFEEMNPEKDAQEQLEVLDLEFEAARIVRELKPSELENIALSVYGSSAMGMSSAELKRDLRIYAKDYPETFLKLASNDQIMLRGYAIKAVAQDVLRFDNGRFFNGKDLVLTVPFGDDEYDTLARYFKGKEGQLLLEFVQAKVD
jgi:hypothetical protein